LKNAFFAASGWRGGGVQELPLGGFKRRFFALYDGKALLYKFILRGSGLRPFKAPVSDILQLAKVQPIY